MLTQALTDFGLPSRMYSRQAYNYVKYVTKGNN